MSEATYTVTDEADRPLWSATVSTDYVATFEMPEATIHWGDPVRIVVESRDPRVRLEALDPRVTITEDGAA
jgi:hypothetical protein